jgi:HD-GYP domain-containing protein (c-di-GMP phosphodiesterase class II)
MIDLTLFKDFFFSLSQITRLNIQVWDGKGLVFSSAPDQASSPVTSEIRDLSARILSLEAPQNTSHQGHHTICGVPLRTTGKIVGALIAYSSDSEKTGKPKKTYFASPLVRPGGSRQADMQETQTFLALLAGLMEERWVSREESEEMAEELSKHFEDLYLYSKVATQIKTLRFSNAMLMELIKEILETMRADLAFARLPGREEYNAFLSAEAVPEKRPALEFFVKNLVTAIPENEPSLADNYFIINDSRISPTFSKLHPRPYRFLAVMTRHAENFYGWLGLVSFNLKEIFRRSELRLLISIAEQVAVVISNTDLYNDLERFVFNVVKSLVYAIEAKDVYTRGHSERVSRYCLLMAEHLQLEENQKNHLHWASILHDIGKIGIPESILTKPDRLTDEEYRTIRDHPEKGHTILKPLDQLSASLPSILHHHERYDGTGYPRRLKGEEIPLLARVIAVADTFDAITSDRAYRPARTPQEALAIIKEVAGSQLDPALVDIFREVYSKIDLIREDNDAGEC